MVGWPHRVPGCSSAPRAGLGSWAGGDVIGVELAAALLLAVAGGVKLSSRDAGRSALAAARLPGAALPAKLVNRGAGILELLVALGVIAFGGRAAGVLLVLSYGALAAVSARMVALDRGQDCGCFGRPSPISHWHTGLNVAAAVAGLVGVAVPARAWPDLLGQQPGIGLLALVGAGVLAYLGYLLMTALPELLAETAQVLR